MKLDTSKFVEVLDGSLVFNVAELERAYLDRDNNTTILFHFVSGDKMTYEFMNKVERNAFWNHLKRKLAQN